MAEAFSGAGEALRVGASATGGRITITIGTDNVEVAKEVCKTVTKLGLGLGALYAGYSLLKPLIDAAVEKAFGGKRDDQDIRDIKPGCLHVDLHCFTDKRFLEVLADYESGRMKKRLQEELSLVGIKVEGLKVTIENMEEVNEIKEAIKNKVFMAEHCILDPMASTTSDQQADTGGESAPEGQLFVEGHEPDFISPQTPTDPKKMERAEEIEDVERKFTQCKEAYSNVCRMWKRERRNVVKLLRDLADAIETQEENSRIAKLAGAGLAVGGAVAAIFTYGASFILTAIGAGLAAAGGTTLAATEIVNNVLRSRNLENVNKALKIDGELTKNLWKQTNEVRQIEDELETLRKKNLTKPRSSIATKVCSTVYTAYLVRRTISDVSKGLRVFGIVANLITIPLDVYTLITTSVDDRNTSIVEIVKVIREKAQEIEDEMEQVPDDLE